MIPIMEFQARALQGPVMKSNKFDLAFSKKLRELVAEREIVFDPEQLIADDAVADSVFDAGVKLLAEVGLYHLDTQRVIELSEAEIRQLAQEYCDNPPTACFGSGDDQIEVRYRTCDEQRPPILAAGVAGVIEQEWFVPAVKSMVQEPTNRALGIAGGIASVNGIQPKAGTLSEMYCAQWECDQLLKILDDCGRPGMHLGLLCTASSVGATMACIEPGRRDARNTQIGVHIIPEQKVDWARFMLAKFCQDRGITPWISCVSVMGGLCRHGPDVAVGLIANLLGQLCYSHGSLANLFVNRMDGTWGDPECLWATSAACRAVERNIRVPVASVVVPRMDLIADTAGMLMSGAIATALTGSGFSYAWIAAGGGHGARAIGEMMNGVAGLTREQSNELLHRILAEVSSMTVDTTPGAATIEFPDLYNLDTCEPKEFFSRNILEARERLAGLGMVLS